MEKNRSIHCVVITIFIMLFLKIPAVPAASETGMSADDDIRKLKEEVRLLKEQVKALQANQGKGALSPDREAQAEKDASSEISELDALLKSAEEEVGPEAEQEKAASKPPEETTFRFKGLSLNRLNPEISVSSDFVAAWNKQDNVRRKFDFDLRSFEVNVQAYLDPYSRFKSTVPVDGDGNIEVEEAYFTRIVHDVNLSLGRFRQQFGVINRWHGDALDQVNYPLPVAYILGDDGLYQTGLSVDMVFPELWGANQELTLQVTDSDNDHLFDGETLGTPSLLCHYKQFRELSMDTYFEFGLSGLYGWKDEWRIDPAGTGTWTTDHDALPTVVVGADMTLVWEPVDKSMYRNIEWRSEIIGMQRDIMRPDGAGRDGIQAWGAFSYLQSKVGRSWYLGCRVDFFKPDAKDYAGLWPDAMRPFADSSPSAHVWQVAPYVTWLQSEFVRFRLEYNHINGQGMQGPGHIVMLQAVVAAGPHKHERY